jgi:hypothetical protein
MVTRRSLLMFLGLLCIASQFNLNAQVVMPQFSLLGKRGEASIQLFQKSTSGINPTQMSLDISTNGLIYAFTAEYEGKQEIFDDLKAQLQKTMQAAQTISETNLMVWRNEPQKFSVQLSFMRLPSDNYPKKVRVTAVSIDKTLRGK